MSNNTGRALVLCVMIAATLLAAGVLTKTKPTAAPIRAQDTVSTRALSRLFDMELQDYRGTPHALSQWKGKILVINFWATWCAPCREEMPYFSRMSREYSAHGVQFIGISSDSPGAVRTFADQEKISYPLLVDEQRAIELSAELGNSLSVLPYTLILGKNGEPLLARTGRLPEHALESLLRTQFSR